MDARAVEDVLRIVRGHPEARKMFEPVNMAQPEALVMIEPVGLKELKSRDCNVLTDPNCNKNVTGSSLSLPIALAVTIPIVGIGIALIFLHRRHIKRQKAEDAADRHASLDFGLGEVHRKKKAGEKGAGVETSEFDSEKHSRQLSMDMSSPYLLPPELQSSRESLRSMSRSGHNPEDPYRPVEQYLAETGSMRSFRPRHDGSSIYTGSSGPSRLQDTSTAELLSNAQRMSRTSPPNGFVLPPRQNSLARDPTSPIDPLRNGAPGTPGGVYNPVEAPAGIVPVLQMPAPVAAPVARKGLSTGVPGMIPVDGARGNSPGRGGSPAPPPPPSKMPEYISELPNEPMIIPEMAAPPATIPRKSPPQSIILPTDQMPPRKQSLPVAQQAVVEDFDATSDYGDGFQVTPPSPGREEQIRGQRYSMDVPPEEFVQAGLGAPGFDAKRLSMGFRPLPPDSLTADVEDPETRANRIRSFYKEYFDDSKPAPQGQYYEDYDQNYLEDSQNYLGDAAYYDPDSNQFVMPGAAPITRRAMTPPPQAQRFMGQGNGPPRPFMGQGPPRPRNGSMGGMSSNGPRFMGGNGGPRPYSSASNRGPGPRAYSSASGRGPSPRGRPLPPPQALTSLPTPSKLRDDSFALMGATDFAPPVSYRDRQHGRSESPLGDRRPYSPLVPAHRPLATAYDELAPIPSPHSLRKSGTFTSLDFAPPRRVFRDDGSGSDSGSIRSNRSGVSQMANAAIRKGAYRVSRLPQDGNAAVPTKDSMSEYLKPSWGMRQGS